MDPLQHHWKHNDHLSTFLKVKKKVFPLLKNVLKCYDWKMLDMGLWIWLKNASEVQWIQSRQLNKEAVNIRDASLGPSFSSKYTASEKGLRISVNSPVGSLNCRNFWLTHWEIKAWHGFVGLHWTSTEDALLPTGFRIPQWTLSVFIRPIKPSLNHKSWAWWRKNIKLNPSKGKLIFCGYVI